MAEPSRKLLHFLIVVHIAAYGAACAFADQMTGASFVSVFFLSLIFAQQSLLCLWAGLGAGSWRFRLIAAYALSVLIWSLPGVVDSGFAGWYLAVTGFNVAVLMAIILAPLAVMRAWGFHLHRFSNQDLPAPRRFQFSVRAMLLATVVVACLLAFGASTGDIGEMHGNSVTGMKWQSTAIMFAALPILLLASALISVWAALSTGTVAVRMIVGALAIAAGGAFLPYCHHADAVSYAFWASLTLLTFLITSSTLLAFRTVGYRFSGVPAREVSQRV